MVSIVGHIIAAKFLELSLRRYRARVLALEASPAFRAWRRDGRIEAHWFPVMAGDCRNDVLGQFTATGFRFACPEFAATYAAASGLAADAPDRPTPGRLAASR